MTARIEKIEKQFHRQDNFSWSDTVQISEKIRRHFDESELEILMMMLGIDDEEIVGKTHSQRVRELVSYCQRRDMLIALVEAAMAERPLVKWPSLFDAI